MYMRVISVSCLAVVSPTRLVSVPPHRHRPLPLPTLPNCSSLNVPFHRRHFPFPQPTPLQTSPPPPPPAVLTLPNATAIRAARRCLHCEALHITTNESVSFSLSLLTTPFPLSPKRERDLRPTRLTNLPLLGPSSFSPPSTPGRISLESANAHAGQEQ